MTSQPSNTGFQRRIYYSPMQLVRDLGRIARSARSVLALSSRNGIAADLRERIMLVVTGVNRCRHCAWGHEIMAHRAGLSSTEIAGLLALDLANCPDNEIPGLLFSIHWAENDGAPAEAASIELEACYGLGAARQIEAAALLIHTGNRIGNTFDYLLSRISGGRFGLLVGER